MKDGCHPFLFQSNFLGNSHFTQEVYAIKAMWHGENGPKLERHGVYALVRLSWASDSSLCVESPISGPDSHRLNCWRGGPLGRKTRFLAFPNWNLGLFSININAKKLQNASYPLEWPEDESEGRGLCCRLGLGFCLRTVLLNLAVPEKHQSLRWGGKKILHSDIKSQGKITFKSILDHNWKEIGDFPGGSIVKNPPATKGQVWALIWKKIPHAASCPRTTTTAPVL